MDLALKAAETALKAGEVPIGCVIVLDNEIIATAGRSGRDVVPCFWQRGGPLRLASDTVPTGPLP